MGNLLIVSQLLLTWLDRATQLSALLTAAHAEGREITDEEMNQLYAADDLARADLQRAIDAKRGA
jgi:hypothetical protein